MEKKKNTLEYLKRQAKTIKKMAGITHTQALDIVAEQKGFNNWGHLLSSIEVK